jgi:hypothetical protein
MSFVPNPSTSSSSIWLLLITFNCYLNVPGLNARHGSHVFHFLDVVAISPRFQKTPPLPLLKVELDTSPSALPDIINPMSHSHSQKSKLTREQSFLPSSAFQEKNGPKSSQIFRGKPSFAWINVPCIPKPYPKGSAPF